MRPAARTWDSAFHKSNEWLNQLAVELGTENADEALPALRGVLHALRDRLPPDEATDLAAQLPLFIKGVYFEGWHPAATPVRARTRQAFLALVAKHAGRDVGEDEAETMARAVFRLLANRVTAGEIEDVRGNLPVEVGRLWPAPLTAGRG